MLPLLLCARPCTVRGLFTAHPPGGASAGASAADETLLFDAAALGLFFSMTFFGLLLTYGTAAPTGAL